MRGLPLDDPATRQVVERRHGAGTYARRTSPAHPLDAVSFREDMERRGLRPATRVLWSDERPADEDLAAGLGIGTGEPVVHVARLRLADDEPMASEVLHVPAAVAPGLCGADLEGGASWYELLEVRYGRRIADGTQTAEPVLAEGEDAALLGVPSGSPAWRFVRTSRDAGGDTVERVDALVRADRYLVELPITRPRGRHR